MAYVQQGGSVLILLGEGGESKSNTNINYILEQFGMNVNSDSLIRTNFFKYHHPKEVYVSNGMINQDVVK
jgi:intraflagellar transport protein 52